MCTDKQETQCGKISRELEKDLTESGAIAD